MRMKYIMKAHKYILDLNIYMQIPSSITGYVQCLPGFYKIYILLVLLVILFPCHTGEPKFARTPPEGTLGRVSLAAAVGTA